jgi:hypothetical protein
MTVQIKSEYNQLYAHASLREDALAAPICLWVADFFAFERVAPNGAFKEYTRLKSGDL